MAYHDALVAKWATLTGTTQQKLDVINALTVSGPAQDVPVSAVESYLSIRGLLTRIEDWLDAAPVAGVTRTSAKELMRTITSPHVDTFAMSDPDTYARVQGMLGLLAADPPGLVSPDDVTALLQMAQPPVPWWQSAGYLNAIDMADIGLSGLDGSTWRIVVGAPAIDPTNGNVVATVSFQNAGATVFSRQTFGDLSDATIQAWANNVLRAYINNTASGAAITSGTPLALN